MKRYVNELVKNGIVYFNNDFVLFQLKGMYVNMNNVGLIFCKLEYIVNKCEK